VDKYLSRDNSGNILVVSHLNQEVRNALKEEGKLSNIEFNLAVREPNNISPKEDFFANNYSV
jgi:hypothetical protein